MRQNKSGNVGSMCKFNQVMEGNMANVMEQEQKSNCCPRLNEVGTLYYQRSAYPTTLRCIIASGCAESM